MKAQCVADWCSHGLQPLPAFGLVQHSSNFMTKCCLALAP